jgi:hypothetical protein
MTLKVTERGVQPGMSVSVDLGHIRVSTTISNAEVIDVVFRGQDYLRHAFAFEDPEDLEFWQALRISEETLELTA